MKTENILITVLIVVAFAGLVWSAYSFYGVKGNKILEIENTQENFDKAIGSELPDKCKTPQGYTDEAWREHMSHHPDRYVGCFGQEELESILGYTDIESDDLAKMLENKNFTLIDVHIPEQEHIPETDQFIPYNTIAQNQDLLPKDKDATIVLYCRSGSMSAQASQTLLDLGYSNVFNLVGGTNAWKSMGYEVSDVSLELGYDKKRKN